MGGLLILTLCGCHPAAQQAPAGAPPPPQVTVSHPLPKEIVDYNEFTARLGAVNSVDIRARVTGYLQKVNFKDGVEVKKGDVLFIIDPRPYQAELDSADAALERAKTQLDLATNDNKRAMELFQNKAISAEELDTRSKNLLVANSAMKIAAAAVETAKLNLDYTNIAAPIDGRVSRAMVTEGNLVNASGSESTLLTTLVSVDPIYAYFDVDEATVLRYQSLDKGMRQTPDRVSLPCQMALGNQTTFSYKGTLDFVDNQIDSTTGTLRARGVFSNVDRMLIPGEFGRVRVVSGGKYEAMLIPDYAINSDQDKKIVYVVGADQTIQPKQVTPGQLVDGLRVIKSGLDANDLVVLDRLQIIRPGMTVVPKEQPITPPTTTTSDAPADPANP